MIIPVAVRAAGDFAEVARPGGFTYGTFSGTTSQDDAAGDPHNLLLNVNRKKTKVTVVFFAGDRGKGTGELLRVARPSQVATTASSRR